MLEPAGLQFDQIWKLSQNVRALQKRNEHLEKTLDKINSAEKHPLLLHYKLQKKLQKKSQPNLLSYNMKPKM